MGKLYGNIEQVIEEARSIFYRAAKFAMVPAYWKLGRLIVEEQNGKERANYGEALYPNDSCLLYTVYVVALLKK